MKKLLTLLLAGTMTVTALGAAVAPASAAPYQSSQHQSSQHQATQHKQHQQKPRFEQHGSYALYNGHKGYKQKRSGYRYYDGYWFPPSAFIAGAVIGGILGAIISNAH